MSDFTRPRDGIRFQFGGMNINSPADALSPTKYALAVNVRAYTGNSVQGRPGQSLKFSTGSAPITDVCSYAALNTDAAPIYLTRDTLDAIWIAGVNIGTLAAGGLGASMIPVRPGASPVPYIYVANGSDYQKFSAGTVIQSKVGIAEPQTAVDASISSQSALYLSEPFAAAPAFAPAGSAGSVDTSNSRVVDTIKGVFPDPLTYLTSLQVQGLGDTTGEVAGINITYNGLLATDWSAFLADCYAFHVVHLGQDLTTTALIAVFGTSVVIPSMMTYALGISVIQAYTGEAGGPTYMNPVFQLNSGNGGPARDALVHSLLAIIHAQIGSYATAPNVVLSGGGGIDATAVAVMTGALNGGLYISSIVVTNPGSAYTSDPTVTIDPPPSGPTATADAFITTVSLTAQEYQRSMAVLIDGQIFIVQDVLPALQAPLVIQDIYYFSGSTGRCVVSPIGLSSGPSTSGQSLYSQNLLSTLRRGALVKIGTEVCFVLSTTLGPNGAVCFETITSGAHTSADSLSGVPAISVISPMGIVFAIGDTIRSKTYAFPVSSGIGTITAIETASPLVYQPDDYVHVSLRVDDLTLLNEIRLQFDVGDGSFTQNYYYFTIRPSDITQAIAGATPTTQLSAAQIIAQRAQIDAQTAAAIDNQFDTTSSAQTLPGASQWTEILVPISSLTRIGNDQTRTLFNINAVQLYVNSAGDINVQANGICFQGGNQPDVGDVGAPYKYLVRPRSVVTGVVGNPSPVMRYGVNPRREQVTLMMPSAAYDAQIDTWDIFRYGGSVTSYRYIGSVPSVSAQFIDNYSDAAARAGDAIEYDNFEPWPSIDVPANGIVTSVIGTTAVVGSPTANILRYLPGTLVQLGGQNVFTLRARPTFISGTSYLLEFVENAGVPGAVNFNIQEPILANQKLPYMFGTDATGTVFACGDPLRAGTLYFSKNYAPDSAPDAYNLEITPPSEPLLGGEVIDGLALVASPERWWALYPQPNLPQRYNVVLQPFTRGLAAPFGHCNDGVSLYWWAKDGIYSSTKGALTDDDLYSLFPHEGVIGQDAIYNGVTISAPDYSQAATFRLAYANGYLYATYKNSAGVYCMLVLDVQHSAWSADIYSPKVSCVYHPSQPVGTLLSTSVPARYDEVVMGTIDGRLAAQITNTNDLGGAIPCKLASFEYDGGDLRAPKQWGDFFVDLTPSPAAGVSATPMSLGAPATSASTLVSASTRQRLPVSVGGIVVSDFMGLLLEWTDDYASQNQPTQLNIWHPSFVVQPARTIGWETFGTSYGQSGYMHIREVVIAYVSSTDVTLTITSYDGQSPSAITLPSTGGLYKKVLFPVSANKGQLFKFAAASAGQFQIFEDDCEVRVGPWARQSAYSVFKNLGGPNVANAPV